MTVLDTSIPYEKVLMVMARKTIRKEIELNPKFHYVEFDESLKEAWCKLQTHDFHRFDSKGAYLYTDECRNCSKIELSADGY